MKMQSDDECSHWMGIVMLSDTAVRKQIYKMFKEEIR